MIDKRIQMMDAGMRLFQTEKPFGTVLGGIKTEMAKYGKVLRANEIDPSRLPDSTGESDLFLDWSSATKYRYISCKLEDAGEVGTTDEGEPVHRYAVLLKEGNGNKPLNTIITVAIFLVFLALAFLIGKGRPSFWLILMFLALGSFTSFRLLRPSKAATELISKLLDVFKEAK